MGRDGREHENKGEKEIRELKIGTDMEGKLNLVYCDENRKREGELDGNTVYWEYKKG